MEQNVGPWAEFVEAVLRLSFYEYSVANERPFPSASPGPLCSNIRRRDGPFRRILPVDGGPLLSPLRSNRVFRRSARSIAF